MSGPTTGPIPLRERAEFLASAHAEEAKDRSREPGKEDPPSDAARALKPFIAALPRWLRPLVRWCPVCVVVFLVGFFAAAQWRFIAVSWIPVHTASVAQAAETAAHVASLEQDIREIRRMLDLNEISYLQEHLCHVRDEYLTSDLQRKLEDYRSRNGSYPPSFNCPQEQTK